MRQIFPEKKSAHVKQSAEHASVDILYANGDSWPWGAELGDESEEYRLAHSYPGLVANKLNIDLQNNSLGGGSNSRTFRTTIRDISKLLMENKKPFALITWTELHRFELYDTAINTWQSFPNPNNTTNKELTDLIWGRYSTDASDLETFLSQLIALESFLKVHEVPYIMIASCMYPPPIKDIGEYMIYKSVLDNTNYIASITLNGYLRTFTKVDWGANQHPLENGHKIVADFLLDQIHDRYILE